MDRMEQRRFDVWAKALARRAPRRAAVGRLVGGAAIAAAAGGLGRLPAAAQGAATPTANPGGANIAGEFVGGVYQGPDKGLVLQGTLRLTGDKRGRLSGQLVPATGAAVPVSGQLNGVAINLVFYLPGNRQLFGVGSIGQRPDTGTWVAGGPLVGPKPGDSGDWVFCLECHISEDGQVVCIEIKCPINQ